MGRIERAAEQANALAKAGRKGTGWGDAH